MQPAIVGSLLVTMGLALVVAVVWLAVGLTAVVHHALASWHTKHPGYA